jgi:hypothetical protein
MEIGVMMKKVCMFLILLGWYAIAGNPIELGVVSVLPDDSLNVRKNPSHKSHIVATLAPFVRGFYTTKTLPHKTPLVGCLSLSSLLTGECMAGSNADMSPDMHPIAL